MKNKTLHTVDTVFVLILFAIFVIMALLVTCSGALAYQKSVEQTESRFNKQTCVSYTTAKMRSNNEEGKISLGELDGIPALCITDDFGGDKYITYIYQYDGMVRELFCAADVEIDPSAGSALAEAEALAFSREGGLYKIELTDKDGIVTSVYVNTV